MDQLTIDCHDCRHEVETMRRNTKYCSVCRLIRDLPYVRGNTRTCGLCDSVFAPLDLHDRLCGDCTPKSAKHGDIECAFCHEPRPRVRADVAVCDQCARDPENRKRLWASLKRKQEQRKEAST